MGIYKQADDPDRITITTHHIERELVFHTDRNDPDYAWTRNQIVAKLGGTYINDAVAILENCINLFSTYKLFKEGKSQENIDKSDKKHIKKYAQRYFLLPTTGWKTPLVQRYLADVLLNLMNTKNGLRNTDEPINIYPVPLSGKQAGCSQSGTGTTGKTEKFVAGFVRKTPTTLADRKWGLGLSDENPQNMVSFNLSTKVLLFSKRAAIHTIIHEASHAWADTVDNDPRTYLDQDGKSWDIKPPTMAAAVKTADATAWFAIKVGRRATDTYLTTDHQFDPEK